jgi:riboflavin transporter FmnP
LWGLDDGYIANSFDTIFHWGITNDSDIRLAILLLPFNAIKNAIVIAVTFVAYKPLRFLLEKVYK